jgi:hypothetical protein
VTAEPGDGSQQPCANCSSPYDAQAIVCPFCRAPRGLAGIARAGDHGGLGDGFGPEDRLARVITEDLLARSDGGLEDLLTRDLAGPLSPNELRDALSRVDQQSDPSLAELEGSLTRESSLALDGITLAELVGGSSANGKILKRGLAFLRNRRWTEAMEWWSLHRENLDARDPHLELLLLLMEGFTYRLAGDPARAAQAHALIVAHPLYRRMRGLDRK